MVLICVIIVKIAVDLVIALVSGVHGTEHISKGIAILILVLQLLCSYAAGFGWSWGPLCWLVPSEIFPLKYQISTGQSIAVAVQFLAVFVLSQSSGLSSSMRVGLQWLPSLLLYCSCPRPREFLWIQSIPCGANTGIGAGLMLKDKLTKIIFHEFVVHEDWRLYYYLPCFIFMAARILHVYEIIQQ